MGFLVAVSWVYSLVEGCRLLCCKAGAQGHLGFRSVVAVGLQSVWASVVGAHRLKCPATCGIFPGLQIELRVACICRQAL